MSCGILYVTALCCFPEQFSVAIWHNGVKQFAAVISFSNGYLSKKGFNCFWMILFDYTSYRITTSYPNYWMVVICRGDINIRYCGYTTNFPSVSQSFPDHPLTLACSLCSLNWFSFPSLLA